MQQQGEHEHLSREWAILKDPVLHTERLEAIRNKKGYIIDMDGVIYHVSFFFFFFSYIKLNMPISLGY
jgi:hypothetical protein